MRRCRRYKHLLPPCRRFECGYVADDGEEMVSVDGGCPADAANVQCAFDAYLAAV